MTSSKTEHDYLAEFAFDADVSNFKYVRVVSG